MPNMSYGRHTRHKQEKETINKLLKESQFSSNCTSLTDDFYATNSLWADEWHIIIDLNKVKWYHKFFGLYDSCQICHISSSDTFNRMLIFSVKDQNQATNIATILEDHFKIPVTVYID